MEVININNIEVDQLLKELSNNHNLNIIDIRSNYQYQLNRIPTSQNIPTYLLESTPEKYLDKNKTYYIYCQSGHTSKVLVDKLNRIGYKTVNINGGFNNYLLRK